MKIKDREFFELLKEYLTVYLPFQRIVSPHTIKSYKETLNLFLGFICSGTQKQLKDLSFSDITADTMNDFLYWLDINRNCCPATQNHHLSVIRAFLKYSGMKKPTLNAYYLTAGQVARRKTEKKLTVDHFSEAALNAMLDQPNPENRIEHRDMFYMILLYDTGARNGEVLNLYPKDLVIDTNSPYVVIHGKGRKIRRVPLLKETTLHYESYIKRFHGTFETGIPLFYTVIHSKKMQMSADNVARFIRKYATAARSECNDVPDNVTPHMFRHSRALSLYRKGVPLPLISEWLGHSNLETTLIYAYADTEMKRVAIEKATSANHPIRAVGMIESVNIDDDTLKRLYGLK